MKVGGIDLGQISQFGLMLFGLSVVLNMVLLFFTLIK